MVLKFKFYSVDNGTPKGDLIGIFKFVANGYTTGNLGDLEWMR